MPENSEPAENISGGEAEVSSPAEFASGEAATRAEAVVDRLGDLYWQKTYGGRDAFECLVRTILSQNTSDVASQPAHDALTERYGGADDGNGASDADGTGDGDDAADLAAALADADHDELADTIRSAGLYNRKADVLTTVAARVLDEYGSAAAFDAFVRERDPEEVRTALLDMDGVGPKTADCVLLFAGGRSGVFPVDTHVHRIYRRLGVAPADADHEAVRAVLEREVPDEKCGFGHTASIQFGREYCSARKPACLDGLDECPMSDLCDRVGVDTESDSVVDPADAD
ncbi:endonuclease III [Halorussus sp. MSC15.2]|uniref:endonuclease III domain-containing protein n=1 Tax=Halorussus sp. MSC15.2 TaxID=2283638 RepID=UPI0013D2F799|nr:endonuclease III [Halorussus sp. MSC15.2]NEU57634.1 endonuclease III [Halorussus sp. MSC15.2]